MPKKSKDKIARPPETNSLDITRAAAKKCLVCDFAKRSTQTVFGEGSKTARLMIVGEIPGDIEDRKGHPFCGPAGHLLAELFEELKVNAKEVYVTNAVKHFKFVQRGKRRLHQKPDARELRNCHPWLEKELDLIKPPVILALGSTAGRAICDRLVRIGAERGSWLHSPYSEAKVLISWHPSAILRSPDETARHQKRAQLKDDLLKAWREALSLL